MLQDMKHVLRIGVDRTRDFLRRFAARRQLFVDFALQLQKLSRGLLSRFNAWLMIRVDLHQRSIKSYRAFVKGDQSSNAERPGVRNRERDRLAPFFVKRGASSAQKTVEILATAHARLDVE